jgi:hypothetical protein
MNTKNETKQVIQKMNNQTKSSQESTIRKGGKTRVIRREVQTTTKTEHIATSLSLPKGLQNKETPMVAATDDAANDIGFHTPTAYEGKTHPHHPTTNRAVCRSQNTLRGLLKTSKREQIAPQKEPNNCSKQTAPPSQKTSRGD